MKIKTKLRLGFGFLFLVVIFFGAIALFYLNEISLSAKVVLKDNYKSLGYVMEMRAVLDNYELPLQSKPAATFKGFLEKESINVTEPGEEVAVKTLRQAFNVLADKEAGVVSLGQSRQQAREQLRKIDELNMNAIVKKNDVAQKKVERAVLYLTFSAAMCFFILFSFSINFPGFVANPLREFSEAIKQISSKNYKQRLEFSGNNEFSELAAEFNAMASQLNKWENSNVAKLLSEKLRIEAIIAQMQDAIIGLNEKQEILFLNKVAAQLLNLNETAVIGCNAGELAAKNDLLNALLKNTNGDKPIKIYANEKESFFQLEKMEITVPENPDQLKSEVALVHTVKDAGEVFILRNITQYKELDEAKTNFIATVSHELKTPISSIKMSLKLLNDARIGTMNVEQQQLVAHIGDDSNRLLKITSELLDLAQVETGNLKLTFAETDPRKIAVYAMDAVKVQAKQQQIELDLIADAQLPLINVDVQKTAWVLVNFLSNALRYSREKSTVIISIKATVENVVFAVKDFGQGIDEQYQQRLFDKYFQVPTDGKNKSGSGLGLAISKDFIEAEAGKIWVESAIGEGSTFYFAIPIANQHTKI